MTKTSTKRTSKAGFRCRECGVDTLGWLGRCPECGEWDSLAEVAELVGPTGIGPLPSPVALGSPDLVDDAPTPTGSAELDRVLSGGVVPGSVTLLGGEPGSGKSTLALQLVAGLAREGRAGMVATAEESVGQVQARARRVGAAVTDVAVFSETSLPRIRAVADELAPGVVVVDSIQTVSMPGVAGGPGSVSQVRGCAQELVELAKTSGIAVVIVGHVTKDGDVAGPRTLEHLVDTVLSLEGDRHHTLRLVRALKHRFGPTDELGVLEMAEAGLADVRDPSRLFLADRQAGVAGSVVVPVLDGARPLMVEVQALLAPSATTNARRSAQGLESGRLAQLLAVLDQRADLELGPSDVYVSAVGGLRVTDPGAHLGLALALASAASGHPMAPDAVALGEVGLGGEVRQVESSARRLREAARLGFSRAFVPPQTPDVEGLELCRMRSVEDAITAAGLT